MARKNKPFTDKEKEIVAYLKQKLVERGVKKFPRDWHLKQSAVARGMLAGPAAPTLEQWKECIDWLFKHKFWGDKVDHLSRVEALWVQYALQGSKNQKTDQPDNDKRKELIKKLYLSKV